jgi:hypothetical protein
MIKRMLKRMDIWSLIVVLLTFVLFAIALALVKGFTHDLLLEGGVFLVSAKLIIMAHKSAVHTEMMEERLDQILEAIQQRTGEDTANAAH